MHKLRIKKKITVSDKVLQPIFTDFDPSKKAKENTPAETKTQSKIEEEKTSSQKINSTPKSTPQGRKRPIPSFSISINSPVNKVAEKSEKSEETNSGFSNKASAPLEDTSLKKAWDALRDFIPKEQLILSQGIKASYPVILSESEFSLTVNNKTQAEILQERMSTVVEFLQQQLQNYSLKMNVEVSDKTESTVVFTANDKFKLMIEQNPALEDLRKRLDLELD